MNIYPNRGSTRSVAQTTSANGCPWQNQGCGCNQQNCNHKQGKRCCGRYVPTPVIINPENGGTTGAQPVISGYAEPGSIVIIGLKGEKQALYTFAADDGFFSAQFPYLMESGDYHVTVTQLDKCGCSSERVRHNFDVYSPLTSHPDIDSKQRMVVCDGSVLGASTCGSCGSCGSCGGCGSCC